MSNLTLFDAVSRLTQLTHSFSDADLGQPWTWRAHKEGVRFALLGTYHELRDLAVSLAQIRAESGPPITIAQRALGQYHAAYRDLQAVLIGVIDAEYDREPAPGEWSLRYVIGHIAGAERHFFTLVHYGADRQRDGQERPARLPDDETDKVTGPEADFRNIMEKQGLVEMMEAYDARHQRAMREFAIITDEEIYGPSLWWEDEIYPLQYRLHRFDAHLRQHTIQAEKTLVAIGRPPNEAKGLLRLIYNALAEVESLTIGAAELGAKERGELAEVVVARADDVAGTVTQAREMVGAVQGGDLDKVNSLIGANASLVDAIDQNQLSLVSTAAYHNQQDIVEALVEAGATLYFFEGATIGRFDIVKRDVERWPEVLNEHGRDGFTLLQLASYFGHEEIALWLIDQGADLHAVAKNTQRIRAIHAAAAGGHLSILQALLQGGADVNAVQQNDFTPLHAAADNGDLTMTQLLLEYGADINASTEDGRTPLNIAQEKGHDQLVPLLR